MDFVPRIDAVGAVVSIRISGNKAVSHVGCAVNFDLKIAGVAGENFIIGGVKGREKVIGRLLRHPVGEGVNGRIAGFVVAVQVPVGHGKPVYIR